MKHPGTRALFDYWTNLRSGRSAPYKAEVSARGIGPVLAGNTFILESLGGGNMRFRLAGAALYDVFGLELRGMSALSIMMSDDRERFGALIDAGLRRPCVCLAHLDATNRAGERIALEMMIAPLRSDFDEMNRMLGSVHALDAEEVPAEPRRCAINAAYTLNFTQADPAEARAPLPGFGEAAAPGFDMTGAPSLKAISGGGDGKTERRRGHLRIVRD
ncbi:MAG: PAS domain-containing protein [Pseudomonadota bacterium]